MHQFIPKNAAALGLGVFLPLLTVVPLSAQQYTIEQLLANDDSLAYDINVRGQVAGAFFTQLVGNHASIWDCGRRIDLGTVNNDPTHTSLGRGLNDLGAVVGFDRDTNTFISHAFLWENGVMTDLGTLPGGLNSDALDINNNRKVIGVSDTASGFRAFLWENGVMTDLGTFGGAESGAISINQNDEIVGWAELPNGEEHAFHWVSGTMTDLGTFGGTLSEGRDINESGTIVGFAQRGTGELAAFRYENNVMTDIGPATGTSLAYHVNNLGQIVGQYFPSGGGVQAVMWENNVMMPLDNLISDPNWVLQEAWTITDLGQIVGVGLHNGVRRAFIMTPGNGLILQPPWPGTAGTSNSFDVCGASPGAKVTLVYDFQSGTSNVPGCPGVQLGLNTPIVFASPSANSKGKAVIALNVPGKASGRTVLLQALEGSTCRESPVITQVFP